MCKLLTAFRIVLNFLASWSPMTPIGSYITTIVRKWNNKWRREGVYRARVPKMLKLWHLQNVADRRRSPTVVKVSFHSSTSIIPSNMYWMIKHASNMITPWSLPIKSASCKLLLPVSRKPGYVLLVSSCTRSGGTILWSVYFYAEVRYPLSFLIHLHDNVTINHSLFV